jgi:hypothetical protein
MRGGAEEVTAEKQYLARARIGTLAVPGALAAVLMLAIGYVLPGAPRLPFWEASVWGLVVLVSFVGYGSLLAKLVVPEMKIDVGLRAAWGASVVCAAGGLLMAFSRMTRLAAMAFVDCGTVLALLSLWVERRKIHQRTRFAARLVRRDAVVGLLATVIVGLCVLHYLAAVAEWHPNPYDDNIAYLEFVKKLSDTGIVVEPFSLRRLAALGGQTLFLLLVSPRADMTQMHTFDRGIALLMTVLLVVSYRTRARRPALILVFFAIVFFLSLPIVAINTASYYAGVVFFFALYRTLALFADHAPRSPLRAAIPLALLAVTACTLRQNYMPVPVAILAISYASVFRRSREPWRARLSEPLVVAGLSVLFLLPWFYVSWASNRTFLYPFMKGTSNPALALSNTLMTAVKELHNQVAVLVDDRPMHVLPLLMVAGLLLRFDGARRPLLAMIGGSAFGTLLVTHAFSDSDVGNLARYVFGYNVALALGVILRVGVVGADPKARAKSAVPITLVVGSICVLFVVSRDPILLQYQRFFRNIDHAVAMEPRSVATESYDDKFYRRLQDAIPAGERAAVMLDEPSHLNFIRNPIWNLDMPGYSSLPPGEPFFQGSEKVADYFRGLGVDYIAFVRPDRSAYHYRREYWIEQLASDEELWRTHAAYIIDFMDSLAELSKRYRILFEERGMVVMDLGHHAA